MTVYFHENDIPNDIQLEGSVAIDTETMGLRTNRDRLCLIQISSGNGDAHLLKIENKKFNPKQRHKNLKKILQNKNILKIFHFARFDLAANFYLQVEGNIWCTKLPVSFQTYTNKHGLSDLTRDYFQLKFQKNNKVQIGKQNNLKKEKLCCKRRFILA